MTSNQNNTDYDFTKVQGMLLYVQLMKPSKAYVKPGAPAKADEWKCSVALTDEDHVDALESYAKTLDTLLSLKKVKKVDFKGIYKVDPPKDAGKNIWVLTLRKSTELGKTGKPVPDLYTPKVFEKIGNNLLDITHSKEVGNGSYGTVSIDRFDRSSGGSSLYLKNVRVEDLIEYVRTESDYEAGSEFDEAPNVKPTMQQTKPTTKEVVKPKAAPQADFDEDDGIPF